MKTNLILMMMFGALAPGLARAECANPYTVASISSDLGSMGSFLRSGNESGFQNIGARSARQIECIDAPMAPVVLANLYRYIGLNHYLRGDAAVAAGWFRTSLELDPSFDWDVNEIGVEHPVRSAFNQERNSAVSEMENASNDQSLAIPAGGRILVDGRITTEARLTPGRPHLVQWIDVEKNSVVKVWLIQGAVLPAELLGAPVVASGNAAVEEKALTVERIERSRPPMKTPALVAGGLGIAAGIGLYAASFSTHKKFEQATTTVELEKYQAATNALVLGAGGALALGVGLGYLGVILDGAPGIRINGQF